MRTATAETCWEICCNHLLHSHFTLFNLFSVYWGYYKKPISDLSQSEENQRLAKQKREQLTSIILVEQTSTGTLVGENETIETLFSGLT